MFCKKNGQDENERNSCQDENYDEMEENIDVGEKTTSEKTDDSIKKLEEENKKLKESLMRALADIENSRRISKEEKEKTMKYGISKFAEDLISTMENFYLAFNFMKDEDSKDELKVKNFIDGIKLTQNELKRAFEKNGLIRLYPLNEQFNPDFHNAIAQVEAEAEEGTIVDVIQAGYKINDRILRPALVAVAKQIKQA